MHQARWAAHRLRIGLLILMAALAPISLTGCTTAVYNRLDTLAGWYLQSLVSLDPAQREELHDWLSETLAWLRRSELNRYAGFLRDVSSELAQPGTADTYQRIEQRFRGFLEDLAAKTTPDAARLLMSLSPTQVDELFSNLATKTRERAEKHPTTAQWRQDEVKDLTKQLKRWTGSVSDAQESLIEAAVAHLEPTNAAWPASQQAWRDAVQRALVDSSSRAAAAANIQQLLAHPYSQWTADYTELRQRNRKRYLELAASLDASLSSQQRERLRAELLKLAQQLAKIAEDRT
ncbi:MAG TPA: DUF6279 family lipoprotein [Steroidobacteraceae bacterium]